MSLLWWMKIDVEGSVGRPSILSIGRSVVIDSLLGLVSYLLLVVLSITEC
jgi:hypothetical protein